MPMKIERLRQALLVALVSDKEGEALAALKVVRKILAGDGKDAHWLAAKLVEDNAAPGGMKPASGRWTPPHTGKDDRWWQEGAAANWAEQLDFLALHDDWLRPREEEFIYSLVSQWQVGGSGWKPTPRQGAWLTAIYSRVKLWA
jgi:hypothetical protein